MICKPCTKGDHCGPPGQAGPHCPCQHYPSGTRQQGQPDAGARPEPSPVSQDPPAPTREPQRRVRDLDLRAYLKRRRPNA